MSQSDQLVSIPLQELEQLRDLLYTDYPLHLPGHSLILSLLEWYHQTPVIEHLKVLSLNGEWQQDGLFLVTDRCDLFIYSMVENNERVQRALRLLNWNQSWRICCLDDRNRNDAHAALRDLNVSCDYDLPFDTLYLSAEDGLKVQYTVPENVLLRRLTSNETLTVNNLWTYRHPGSEVGVRRLIERNYCVGAYDKATGQLMGWCLTFISQCHNALQVEPQFMGRGLGKLIVAKLVHHRAMEGKWSGGYVSPGNEISQKVFKSFGFKKIGLTYWIGTRPREDNQ